MLQQDQSRPRPATFADLAPVVAAYQARPLTSARRKMIVKLGEDLGNLIWEANNRRKAQFLGGR
jgi:hypothetical protein